MRRRRNGLVAAFVAALSFATAACAGVEPWRRSRLAPPHMALDACPENRRLREHVYESREGTVPAERRGGGGCGCT